MADNAALLKQLQDTHAAFLLNLVGAVKEIQELATWEEGAPPSPVELALRLLRIRTITDGYFPSEPAQEDDHG